MITAHEAKSLVALLHSGDELLLERTLTTIGNCGTFSANQVIEIVFSSKELLPVNCLLYNIQVRFCNVDI